jgi:hypothetical protein
MHRQKLTVRRIALFTLIKICFFGVLGYVLCFFALGAVISVFAPNRISVPADYTALNVIGTILGGLTLVPAIFGVLFGCCAWVALKLKSFFSPTDIEVIQDTDASNR